MDFYTENYNISFYLQYLIRWPEYCNMAESVDGRLVAYSNLMADWFWDRSYYPPFFLVMGKSEGQGKDWHGHVTAITVAPAYRRLKLADHLMKDLEEVSVRGNMYYVDLFVRESNLVAKRMYEHFGYKSYRTILDYYTSGGQHENALDMRKSLPLDPQKLSMIALKKPVPVSELYK